jgi:CDP-paratose 2-epimerase
MVTRRGQTAPEPEEKLGICQWFHYQDHAAVDRAVELLGELGVRHLRTGISWADFHRSRGRAWYDWMLRRLEPFEILLSIWHTPPSIAEGGTCAGPPHRLEAYAEFIWEVDDRWGDRYADLELWNEPNNRLKWDFERFDPDWSKFARMIELAARQARDDGKRTVLGGMIPVDPHWLRLIESHGGLDPIDVVAIHGFPSMWWEDFPNWDWYRDWHGWEEKLASIAPSAGGRPIWVTETGLATCRVADGTPARHDLQVDKLLDAAAAPTERLYWYCLEDLDPERPAIEGFHVDENEYHLGLVTWEGEKKPAWHTMRALLAGEIAEDGAEVSGGVSAAGR